MDPSEKNMELLQRGIFSFEAKKYVCRGMCDPHAHREHEIFGVIKGKVTVTISGERRELTKGQMVFISSLEEHSTGRRSHRRFSAFGRKITILWSFRICIRTGGCPGGLWMRNIMKFIIYVSNPCLASYQNGLWN